MTTFGWIFLVISWGTILSFLIFCFGRIIRAKKID